MNPRWSNSPLLVFSFGIEVHLSLGNYKVKTRKSKRVFFLTIIIMVSLNKLSKIKRKHCWGRDKTFLKTTIKLKGVAMFNAKLRKLLKKDLNNEIELL